MSEELKNEILTGELPNSEDSDYILEVVDLKKYFLTKKEFKIVKVPVGNNSDPSSTAAQDAAELVAPQEENSNVVSPEMPVEKSDLQGDESATDSSEQSSNESAEEKTGDEPAKQQFKRKLIHSKTYTKAVNGVSFKVKRGETLGVVGESGCGKSTMGRSILRLFDITGGKVYFEGTDITALKASELRKFRTKMQIIFQDPYGSLPPRSPVGEIIGEAVKVHKIVPKAEHRDYVIDIMRKCGLQDFYFDRYPHEFSGGQRQRICIARALAVKPKFVVCDEPVSALDVSIQAQVINLLKELQRDLGLTYLFISHDLSVVQHISDRVAVMYLGKFVEMGDVKDIFNNPMHPYTHALLSAVPVPDPHYKGNRIVLQGDIPSPANPPSGCKFHTRCSRCMEICKNVEPKFKDYGNGHTCACHLYPQD